MRRGRALGLLAIASAAAVVVWKRRRSAREHVDLYFADGSMVTFAEGSMEGGRLLPIAHSILAAAR